MTKYREILRLKSLEFSDRAIATSCHVSRNTVSKVLSKARELNISWLLENNLLTDADLETILFPREPKATASERRMPDYAYIRKELLRNGVSKKLLWVEYCEECRMNNEEPLMYSRFRNDYTNDTYEEITDGEIMGDGYSFPLDESVYSPDMLSVVSVNIGVYDRGWLYEENIALWCQDGVLKLDSGRGIPALATLPEITPDPSITAEEKLNLSIYSGMMKKPGLYM